jgi:hypothetical protein
MTIRQKIHSAENANASMTKRLVKTIWWLVAVTTVGFIAYNARSGVSSPRVANPDVPEASRAAVAGLRSWAAMVDIGTSILLAACSIAFAIAWKRYPRHPNLLMLIAGTALVWLDPPANWVSFVVYNPELWHYPEDWPWMSISPSIEPLVDFAYATVLVGPVFVAIPLLRRVQARYPVDAFVWRHPLLSLSAITFVLGFVIDATVELFSVSTRIYTYTQVPPVGSIFTGRYNQFPLILESSLVPLVIICAAVLLHRDDTGRTQAEKLAQRLRLLPSRPALASFLVMFGMLSATYSVIFCGSWWAIRAGGFATSVACPWPYPETKIYDPQGFYEKAGHPGPFFEGKWNTWMSGQPAGRPIIEGPVSAGRCGPGHD